MSRESNESGTESLVSIRDLAPMDPGVPRVDEERTSLPETESVIEKNAEPFHSEMSSQINIQEPVVPLCNSDHEQTNNQDPVVPMFKELRRSTRVSKSRNRLIEQV